MFTQFLDKADRDWVESVIIITTVFTINNLIAFSIWTLAGDKIVANFRTPEHSEKLNMLFGIILAAVAAWMLLS